MAVVLCCVPVALAAVPACLPDIGSDTQAHRDDCRFPRSARLLTAADYSYVFDKAQRSADRYFTVLYRPQERGEARLGLAIAKKQLRRAVDRHRVKRLIRETFRLSRSGIDAVDIVVLAKSGLDQQDNAVLRQSLEKHWRRVSCAGC